MFLVLFMEQTVPILERLLADLRRGSVHLTMGKGHYFKLAVFPRTLYWMDYIAEKPNH
jgi:hypothetical protein